jgi:competence protein ComEC
MTYSLVGVALAFGAGILVERLFPLALGNVALLGIATGAAILSVVLARLSRGFLVGLLVAVGALGALRAQSGERSFADLYRRVPELREVTGTVVSYPDLRPTMTSFFFAPDSLSARLRVTVFWGEGAREDVCYGDRLRLKGETELAARLPDFDYRRYLAEQGVFALMDVDGEEGLERLGIGGNRFLRLGNVLRECLLDRLDRVISADVAALAHGLLFGERASLSDEVDEAFRRTGLTHLLAISGMNLAIFLAGLWFVLRLFGLRPVFAYPLVGVSVLAILWLVGLPVSLVRAAILFGFLALGSVLADLGAILRRSVSVTQGLAAAALVILAIRPTALFDVGFQLSFGATAAIVAVVSLALGESESASPRAERNALLERVARYGAGLVAVSLAAQAGTAPFLAWHFGMVYPLSLFANLLVVPLATVAMWVGAVALFLCATPLFPLAGAAFGGLLGAMIWCVARLATLPLTAVAVTPAVGVWLAGVSLYVFGALFLLRRGAQDLLGAASGVLR